ncbi:MAG: hypothetical protein ACI4M9_08265, partial [Succinivibrio sp.]
MSVSNILKSVLVAVTVATVSSAYAAEDIPNPFANLKQGKAAGNTVATPASQPTPVVIPEPPVFDAQSWVLMDYATGRVICEHKPHEKIWPASLTKMMTAYVIGMELKAGRLHMDDDVAITEDAWSKKYTDSSKMFIEV